MIENLGELISPVSSADFLHHYFEQDILYVANDGEKSIDHIFSQDDAELILRQHEDRLQNFMRVGYKEKITFPKFSGSGKGTREWIFNKYEEGWTLIIDYLQDFCLPVTRLLRGLEADFGCSFDVSAFLTPKNAPGIDPHCDRTDVFILQIEGCKEWRIFGQADKNLSIDLNNLAKPTHEISLQPGDVLYLPRGFIHQGETQTRASLSLSIKPVDTLRWVTFLKRLLDVASQTETDLRRSVPLHRREEIEPKTLEALFLKLHKHIRNKDMLQRALSLTQKDLITNMPGMPDSHFEREEISENLQSYDLVEKYPGMPCFIHTNGSSSDQLSFCFPECTVERLPRSLEPALRFITNSRSSFRIDDIPGGLSERVKLILAKRLLREGLLRKIDS